MYEPVLIISDTHYHNFTQYAQTTPSGLNTRLGDILRATAEAVANFRKMGGKHVIHCGDVFHVRGALPPSVLNPVVDMYGRFIAAGMEIHMISGNHDLESDITARISSSVSALESVGVKVYHEPTRVNFGGRVWMFVPWVKDLAALRRIVRGARVNHVVVHAPLNGVIKGIPDHGLTPSDFEGLGLDYAFCGHYHNHRQFDIFDGHVVSVGALTHQNWGDTESLAGYVILDHRNALRQKSTSAPRFVKVKAHSIDLTPPACFADNYVKVIEGDYPTPEDVQTVKDKLLLMGAKAVVVDGMISRPVTTRGIVTTGSAPTLHTILGEYLDRTYPGDDDVKANALEIIGLTDDYS